MYRYYVCMYIYIYIYIFMQWPPNEAPAREPRPRSRPWAYCARWACMYICIYVYVCVYIYIYIYTHMYICVCVYVYVYVYVCVCMCMCIYTYTHTYITCMHYTLYYARSYHAMICYIIVCYDIVYDMYVYICIYIYINVYMRVCIYIYIYVGLTRPAPDAISYNTVVSACGRGYHNKLETNQDNSLQALACNDKSSTADITQKLNDKQESLQNSVFVYFNATCKKQGRGRRWESAMALVVQGSRGYDLSIPRIGYLAPRMLPLVV